LKWHEINARSFSKFKIIKNFDLRSQNKMISIEKNLSDQLDMEEL